jgi:hypothetical protein
VHLHPVANYEKEPELTVRKMDFFARFRTVKRQYPLVLRLKKPTRIPPEKIGYHANISD